MENFNSTKPSFDDLVFEERNKSYGGYQLRKNYTRNFLIAMISSVAFITLLVYSPDIYGFIQSLFGKEVVKKVEKEVIVEAVIEDIPLDPEVPEPPQVQVEPPKVEMIKFLPPEIKPDDQVKHEEIPPSHDEIDEKQNIGNITQDGDTSLHMLIEEVGTGNQIVEDIDNDEVVYSVEEDAEFPGGMQALMKYLQSNIVYPKKAERMGIEGKVIVFFEIDREGKVSKVTVQKGFNAECDAEAVRVIKMLPQWKPAKQNGRPVRVKRSLPVVFRLPD
jgi:protein TonB